MERRTRDPPADTTGRRDSCTDESATSSSRSSPVHTQSVGGSSGVVSREETPGPMPKYRYSREELVKLRESPHSNKRPDCLAPEHDADGSWDPERWFRSFDNSRGSSPLTFGAARDRKRPSEIDRDSIYKRKPSADPKGRLREEEEEGLGIVLSPQRRSFGTGCHVTTTSTSSSSSGPGSHGQRGGRPSSPSDLDRDGRDRRGERRIGSGRLVINREHHDSRDYRDSRGRFDRDPRDRDRDPRDRDLRDRDLRDRDLRDRDLRDRDLRDRDRDRDRDDHRGFSRGMDRFSRNDRLDRRDFGERRYHDNRRGYRRQDSHEEEPEWFTGGPSSQNEVIELHGFEGPRSIKEERKKEEEAAKAAASEAREDKEDKPARKETVAEKPSERPSSRAGSVSVSERNGSVESNESSSPEEDSHQDTQTDAPQPPADTPMQVPQISLPPGTIPALAHDFDFNEFFKIDNIPGLGLDPQQDYQGGTGGGAEPEVAPSGSSRFSQWFMAPQAAAAAAAAAGGSHPSSHNNSRRSSINEEFSYLDELVGGSKSPVIPSPTPPLDPQGLPHLFSPITAASGGGERGSKGPHEATPMSIAQHLHHQQQQQQQQQQNNVLQLLQQSAQGEMPPVLAQSGGMLNMGRRSDSPEQPSTIEANLRALLMGGGGGGVMKDPSQAASMKPPFMQPALPVGGKVLTAAEFEASLAAPRRTPPPNISQQPSLVSQPNHMPPQLAAAAKTGYHQHPASMKTSVALELLRSKGGGATQNGPSQPLAANDLYSVLPAVGLGHPPPPVPPSMSKVTTVSELEASFKDIELKGRADNPADLQTPKYSQPPTALQQQLKLGPQQQQQQHVPTSEQQKIAQQLHQLQQQQQGNRQPPPQTTPPQQPQVTTPESGMTAFNKLVGLMKASGSLPQTPKMPKKADGRPLSPLNIPGVNSASGPQHKAEPIQLQQKDLIQLQKLLAQQAKLQQQAQQAQAQLQQQKQQQQQQQQQQLQAKLAQQQQQQKQINEQIMKFMKQNPAIFMNTGGVTAAAAAAAAAAGAKPPASPITPGMTLQAPASPRCPSPVVPQGALLQQPPPSPRAPSPIMFGSQPPMHLTAPSPVHANQLSQTSQTLSPNTALQRSGLPQRVPSPQELIVHTQAIMQSALIKKQLEDQKERFLKRQQETRGKSPNSTAAPIPTASSGSVTSTPATQSKVVPAFMPTSVIRKMASEKAEEERAKNSKAPNTQGDLQESPDRRPPPVLKIVRTDSIEEPGDISLEEDHTDSGFQGTPVAASSEPSILVSPPSAADSSSQQEAGQYVSINIQVPTAMKGVTTTAPSDPGAICVPSIEIDGGGVSREGHGPQMNLQQHLQQQAAMEELKARGAMPTDISQPPPGMVMPQQQQQQQQQQAKLRRALVGTGSMNLPNTPGQPQPQPPQMTGPPPPPQPQPVTTNSAPAGRAIVKNTSHNSILSPPPSQRALTSNPGPQPGVKVDSPQRAIVGSSGQQPQGDAMGAAEAMAAMSNKASIEHQRYLQQQQQSQQQQTPTNQQQKPATAPVTSSTAPRPITTPQQQPGYSGGVGRGGVPVRPGGMQGLSQAQAASALLVQRMMHSAAAAQNTRAPGGMQQMTPQVNPLSQLGQINPLAALQAAQAQQQGAAPHLPVTSLPTPPTVGQQTAPRAAATMHPMVSAAGLSTVAAAQAAAVAASIGASQRGIPASPSNTLAAAAAAMNMPLGRPISPLPQQIPQGFSNMPRQGVGNVSPQMAALIGSRPGGEANLTKWFGSDMFKQQLPNMPPLPTQGQRVLTVDEIERRQQTVTH